MEVLSHIEEHGFLPSTVTTVWDRSCEPDWWRVAAYLVGCRNAATVLTADKGLDDELTLLTHIAQDYAVMQEVYKVLPRPGTDNTRKKL